MNRKYAKQVAKAVAAEPLFMTLKEFKRWTLTRWYPENGLEWRKAKRLYGYYRKERSFKK